MPGNEGQLALGSPLFGPLQGVGHLHRLAVFVGAEKADIEVEARILEVVGIAAEEGDLLLGGEHQAHIGVLLEPVQMVRPALIQGHHIGAETRGVQRLLLDGRHHPATGLHRLGRRHVGRHRGVDPLGDIGDGLEHVELEVHARDLLGLGTGVEPIAQVVLLGAGDLLESIGSDVVIRQDQAVFAHEGAGSARVETHRRFLQVLEPGVGEFEAVLGLDAFPRRIVVEPHALIGTDGPDTAPHRQRGGHQGLA